MSDYCGKCGETMCICARIEKQSRKEAMSKSELKRLCAQNQSVFDVLLRCLPESPYRDRFTSAIEKLEDMAKQQKETIDELEQRVEEQKRTIETLNTCVGGKDSTTTDNITRIEELERRVKVLTNELDRVKSICLRELGIGIVNENVLNATPQQTAEQIERWHVEWMETLRVGYVRADLYQNFIDYNYCHAEIIGAPKPLVSYVRVVAVPQLPETKEPAK